MVEFEIISSPDIERIGKITHYYENFTLGSAKKADLLFFDTEIGPIHLVFSLKKEGLLVESMGEFHYFSNGKKMKGAKLHKAGDKIGVGGTLIEVKSLMFKNLSEDFKVLYDRRLKEEPELESLIVQLQKELLHLENQGDV